jgi:hypothetical protein
MEYRYDDVDKILGFTTWSDKKKISELFRIDSYMYTELGKDSTKTERDNVRKKSRYIYKAIHKIDTKLGKELIHHIDL